MLVLKNIQRKSNQGKRVFQHQMGDYIRVLKQTHIEYQLDMKIHNEDQHPKPTNLTLKK
jgi:hypothetical protein